MDPQTVATLPVDRRIANLATAQDGLVVTRQLVALGVTRDAIYRRARDGRLHRVHRGVYAVGHPLLSPRGHFRAALLALGPDAVLSHRSAAVHLGLLATRPAEIEVTTGNGRRRAHNVRTHASRALEPGRHVVFHDGLKTTSPARTALDLAELRDVDDRTLERVIDEGEIRDLITVAGLRAVVEQHPGRHGAKRLTALLAEHLAGTTLTRSELEERLLALCAAHGIPRPQVNARLGPFTVDFLWPAQRLVVETDGYRYHRTRAAFERDRARDAQLLVAGYRVVRFTHRQIATEPAQVARVIRRLLEAPSG